MTFFFYLKTKIGKLLANIISGFVRNKEKRHRVRERLDPLNPQRCVNYLVRYYTDVAPIAKSSFASDTKYIWICWLQGIAQAPQLVTNCFQSVTRYKPKGYEVIVITADNYQQHAQLPAVMIKKWEKGIITNTHFSDLIRIFLLARHGGIWIDATCLLTRSIPESIINSPLFLFRSHGEFAFTHIQSCFINSEPNNYVIRKWCAAMTAYWEHENRLIHYFTLHLMFIALMQSDEDFANEFSHVQKLSDEAMHVLLRPLINGDPYSDTLMEKACQTSFIQKLTYKFPQQILEDSRSLAHILSKKGKD